MNPGTPATSPLITVAAARYAPVVHTVGQFRRTPTRSNAGAAAPNATGKAIRIGWSGCPLICAVLRIRRHLRGPGRPACSGRPAGRTAGAGAPARVPGSASLARARGLAGPGADRLTSASGRLLGGNAVRRGAGARPRADRPRGP